MKKLHPGNGFPGRGQGGSQNSHPAYTASPRTFQATPQVTDRNLLLGHLRAVWWSQWREGVRLPAELGIIVIMGGRT